MADLATEWGATVQDSVFLALLHVGMGFLDVLYIHTYLTGKSKFNPPIFNGVFHGKDFPLKFSVGEPDKSKPTTLTSDRILLDLRERERERAREREGEKVG